VILSWGADTLSANLSPSAPAQPLDFDVFLAKGDTVLQAGVRGHVDANSTGVVRGAGFSVPLQLGTAYQFLLTLSDSTAARGVHVPFDVSQN